MGVGEIICVVPYSVFANSSATGAQVRREVHEDEGDMEGRAMGKHVRQMSPWQTD